MAINLKFDLMGNPEPPSIVLANRNGNKLGQLNVNVESIDVGDKFNTASEFSFTLNKYIDGEPTPLWNKVVDFKLVYCPEWDMWFEIKVELDEATETVKTVFCTQLGQAELSQIKVYNIHINEEGDPNWDTNNETYKSTVLCDKEHADVSLLHRLLKDKAPHYSIDYVDPTIQRIQRQFSFDDTSICDAFDEIGEEIGCLFVYNSNSTKGGKPNRSVSVYDLQQNCLNPNCKHRGEFTDVCPKCNSQDDEGNKYGIDYGYGEDTAIFVTADELATEGIQLVTDTDSVKNCFKLEGGDDLMTATIRNCNPNGSDYIWYFSDSLKEDMSDELVEKLESYDEKYKRYYSTEPYELNENAVNQYNTLVSKYDDYYNTKSTCLSCGTEGYFYEQCSNPGCNSKNILTGQKLQTIDTTITGYPDLMTAYYNTIDLSLYLESGLMPKPDIETDKTSAAEQLALLTTSSLSPVAVNVKEAKDISEATAKSAILSMAKVLIKSTYKVEAKMLGVNNIAISGEVTAKIYDVEFTVTNYSDDTDTATNDNSIEVTVDNDAQTFIEQKIEKALNKENTDDYSVTGLFAKEYDKFCEEIKKYALNPLNNFSKACDTVVSILAEQGVGDDGSNEDDEIDKATKKALYDALYKPYFDKQQAINSEIKTRQDEIAIIEGVWDKTDEANPRCTTWGLQQYIEKCQQDIQEELDFEKHLAEDLWLEFCAYRREDKYSNSNYVSDGLNNAELFERANEFIEVAKEEIFKSAELQHSISATLNNLLSLPKFKPLLKSFKTGNWIRVQVDDKVYKLRLLEYGFGYGDSESISVEFSDVTKIKNGVTDVQEVLAQATSMASSYDSVQRQAEKGNVARSTIDQWIVDGLDSADVQIKSNDSEEILLTKNGLLARSYDDITGTYLPEQFKLTHNIMAYTDDNWETVSSALGKHNYKYWKDGNFVDAEGYGLTSKFVNAGYITGSQIIGGEIVSSNYKSGESGTYFDLINGDFEIAGGKIVYDTDNDGESTLTLKEVTIQWSSTNAPEITNITGLEDYLKQLDELEDQLDGRIQTYSQTDNPSESWTEDEYDDHIGDLWINPDDGTTQRWTGAAWTIVTNSGLEKLVQTKAQIFIATPTPPYYVGDLWVQGSSGDIMHCVKDNESGDYTKTDWEKSSKYTDDTRADEAYSLADSAKSVADNAKIIGDNLVDGLGFQETEVTGKYVISPVIAGGHLLIGDTTGTYAQIDTNGKLTCTNADVSGAITATSLTLGDNVAIDYKTEIKNKPTKLTDFENDLDVISSDYVKVESTTDEATGITTTITTVGDNTYTTYTSNDASYLLTNLGVGTNFIPPEGQEGSYTQGFFKVSTDGLLVANNAMIWGTVYATDGEFTGAIKAGSTLYVGEYADEDGNICYNTWIDEDGVLNTINANISGEVRAAKGSIGGFTIEPTETEEGAVKPGGWLYGGELQEGQTSVQIGDDKSIFLSAANVSGTMPFAQLTATIDENGDVVFDDNGDVIYTTTSDDLYKEDWRITVGKNFGITSDGTAYMSNCEIVGGSLKMGTASDGYHTWISSDGVLNASGANIDGKITAVDGCIAGWDIDVNGIDKKDDDDNPMVGMYSGDIRCASIADPNTTSPIRFYAGAWSGEEFEPVRSTTISFEMGGMGDERTESIELSSEEQERYRIIDAKCLTTTASVTKKRTRNVSITTVQQGNVCSGSAIVETGIPSDAITSISCSTVSAIGAGSVSYESKIYDENGRISVSAKSSTAATIIAQVVCEYTETDILDTKVEWNDTKVDITLHSRATPQQYNLEIQYTVDVKNQNFKVLQDGSLYAEAAKISGTIYATNGEFNGIVKAEEGNIAQLQISGGGLTYQKDGVDVYSLNNNGLILEKSDATIRVGDLTLGYDDGEDATVIETSGHLILRGNNDTQLEFMRDTSSITASSDVTLYFQFISSGATYNTAKVWVVATKAPLYPVTFAVAWQSLTVLGAVHSSGTVNITLDSNSTTSSPVVVNYGGRAIQFHNYDDDVYWSDLVSNTNTDATEVTIVGHFDQIKSPENLYITGNLLPSDNTYDLGGSEENQHWNNIYCYTSAIDLSDRNKKNTIQPLSNNHTQIFDALKPVSYKFNVSNNNRTHTGLIAQDVKEAIENAGLTTQDFAGYCEWENDDGTIGCGLRYGEFISLCIDQIQKLKKRVEELEDKIKSSE